MSAFLGTKRILLCLVVAGLVVNIIWALRLESRAEKVGAIVDTYHVRLEALEDVLPQVQQFVRLCANNEIRLDDKGLTAKAGPYTMAMDGESVEISRLGGPKIRLDDRPGSTVEIDAESFTFEGIGETGDMKFYMLPDPDIGVHLADGRGNNLSLTQYALTLWTEKNLDGVVGEKIRILRHEDMEVALQIGMDGESVEISRPGGPKIRLDDQIVRISAEEIAFDAAGEAGGNKFYMTQDPDLGILLQHYSGHQINLTERGMTLYTAEDFMIEARGDVNIRSTGGNVKINGQEIHLNE